MGILAIVLLAICIFAFFIPRIEKKQASCLWKLVYVSPLLLAVAGSAFLDTSVWCAGIYVTAVLMLFLLYATNPVIRKLILGAAAAGAAVSVFLLLVLNKGAEASILADFEKGYATMREHYVLTEEKGIDWDALYAKYRPLFEKADAEGDEVQNYRYWLMFTQEFYDGHVGYETASEDTKRRAQCEIFGRDYGLSLCRLSSGEYVAVNVEGCENSLSVMDYGEDYSYAESYRSKSAEADRLSLVNAGLHNGSIITAWDGKSIEELEQEVDVYAESIPTRDNEEFYRPMHAAGKGGDRVEIRFLDDDGTEKSVEAPALGAYYPRMRSTIKRLDSGVNISNLDFRPVDAGTVMLRIYQMAYDSKSYEGSDYTAMSDEIREKLLAYRDKGYKRIILDLRRNGGGSPFMVGGVVQLFAPKGEHLISYSAVINEKTACFERDANGKYTKNGKVSYMGEDLWADGDIILLVNYETVSAGDLICHLMADYPNVTIMGFTGSNSSCQAVTNVNMKEGALAFSAVPNLGEDGEPIIDSRTDHKRGVPIDHVIPFTEDAVRAIFDNNEDYLLDYAASYGR
ncbi:MAG: hypothetical protein K6E50_13805 [Lachnospiraceae bacterium]|nr:hypothetical protein [Lachnospiraceae bacterium]